MDWGVLVAFGSQTFSVYHYAAHSIQGASIVPVATGLRFPSPNLSPIMLAAGTAYCQEPNGTITKVVLPTHDAIAEVEGHGAVVRYLKASPYYVRAAQEAAEAAKAKAKQRAEAEKAAEAMAAQLILEEEEEKAAAAKKKKKGEAQGKAKAKKKAGAKKKK